MDCRTVRDAVSARADGEPAGMPDTVIAWHLRGCRPCSAFAGALDRFGPPRDVAASTGAGIDVADHVVAMAARIDRAEVWWGMRAALFLVSVGELALAVPDLIGRVSGTASDVHLQRHLGAFQIAYAIGLIVVALRPAKARAMVPLTAALAAAMVGAAVADVAQGIAPALGEAQHSIEIAGLLLVWMLAVRRGWPGNSRYAARPRRAAHGPPPRAVRLSTGEPDGLLGRDSA